MGIVLTTTPSWSLYKIVVWIIEEKAIRWKHLIPPKRRHSRPHSRFFLLTFPAASSPTINNLISFLPNISSHMRENWSPILKLISSSKLKDVYFVRSCWFYDEKRQRNVIALCSKMSNVDTWERRGAACDDTNGFALCSKLSYLSTRGRGEERRVGDNRPSNHNYLRSNDDESRSIIMNFDQI